MENINWIEWIGYIGSLLVAISLTMSSMLRLRWINLAGAVFFTVYGIIINAIPVALVNGFITAINIYYLVKIYTNKESFEFIINEIDHPYTAHFLNYYKKAISKDFPKFKGQTKQTDIALLILRNMEIAGLFMAHKEGDGDLIIDLDYAIPRYQDFKTGQFLFETKKDFFIDQGIKRIIVSQLNKLQVPYYKRMGFKKSENENYIKTL